MRNPFTGSQSSLREANKALLFDTIQKFGSLTQVELAENTGLSTATVSNLVRQLVDDGVFETSSSIRSGRRASLVSISRGEGITAGFCIGVRSLDLCITDSANTLLAQHSLPLGARHQADSTLERSAVLLKETLTSIDASADELIGIGVGLSAPVDYKLQKISVSGILPGWEDVDISGYYSSIFHVKTTIDNDANLAALAQLRLSSPEEREADFVFINAGDGIGSGIVVNGQIMRGATGMAGEIGHIQVDPLGGVCSCGNRGCLNTVVNEQRLVSLLAVTHGNITTLDDLIEQANSGDAGCRRVISDAALRIGTAVADLCISVDPEVIILGGKLAAARDSFFDSFQESVQRLLFPEVLTPIKIILADPSLTRPERGAALLGLESASSISRIKLDSIAAQDVDTGTARKEGPHDR